jgi:hypothetical protein
MNSTTELEQTHDEMKPHHVVAGSAAAVLSLVLHAFLLLLIAHMQWSFFDFLFPPNRPDKVTHVVLQEEPLAQPVMKVPEQTVSEAVSPVEVSQAASVLGLPLEKALVEPPPVPQTRLAGDLRNLAEPTLTPSVPAWEPRQEIVRVEREVVKDAVPDLDPPGDSAD